MTKDKMVNSKFEATDDIKNLKNRLNLNNPYLIKLVDYSSQIKKGLCSTNYLTRGIYEIPHTDLQKEFAMRKKDNKSFSS